MFQKHYDLKGWAHTLDAEEVHEKGNEIPDVSRLFSTRIHPDGWSISGEIMRDYVCWVNSFAACHPSLGRVWGDFETVVFADTEEGFNDFISKHAPNKWDYDDI